MADWKLLMRPLKSSRAGRSYAHKNNTLINGATSTKKFMLKSSTLLRMPGKFNIVISSIPHTV